MNERLAVDMRKYHLLEESGMRAPCFRLNYSSPAFQELLRESFGDLFPLIKADGSGGYWYENYDEESRETTSLSRSLGPDEPWPWHEAVRFLEGWRRLQTRVAQVSDLHLKSMLLSLQLPDPGRDARCYRVYTDVHGMQRLHILHGFARMDHPKPFLAETLAGMLQSQLQGYRASARPAGVRPEAAAADSTSTPRGCRELLHARVSPVHSISCVLSLSMVFFAQLLSSMPQLFAEDSHGMPDLLPVQQPLVPLKPQKSNLLWQEQPDAGRAHPPSAAMPGGGNRHPAPARLRTPD